MIRCLHPNRARDVKVSEIATRSTATHSQIIDLGGNSPPRSLKFVNLKGRNLQLFVRNRANVSSHSYCSKGTNTGREYHKPLCRLRLHSFCGEDAWVSAVWKVDVSCPATYMLSTSSQTLAKCLSRSNPMHYKRGRSSKTSSNFWWVTQNSTFRNRRGPQGKHVRKTCTCSLHELVN